MHDHGTWNTPLTACTAQLWQHWHSVRDKKVISKRQLFKWFSLLGMYIYTTDVVSWKPQSNWSTCNGHVRVFSVIFTYTWQMWYVENLSQTGALVMGSEGTFCHCTCTFWNHCFQTWNKNQAKIEDRLSATTCTFWKHCFQIWNKNQAKTEDR